MKCEMKDLEWGELVYGIWNVGWNMECGVEYGMWNVEDSTKNI